MNLPPRAKPTRRRDTYRCDSFSLVCRIDSVRLKPCWRMSPLAVSTDLESPEFPFDVALFDEASQVLPWDTIGAVYRGRQLVVAFWGHEVLAEMHQVRPFVEL